MFAVEKRKLLFKDNAAPQKEDPLWAKLQSLRPNVRQLKNTGALESKEAKIYTGAERPCSIS